MVSHVGGSYNTWFSNSPLMQLVSHSYATSSVTPRSVAGGLMTHSVMVVETSDSSDAACRTVQ